MANLALSDRRKEEAKHIEEALRTNDVALDAIFWIYDEDLKTWRFFVISPDVEQGDPRKLSKMIRDIVNSGNGKMSFTLFDIELKSPNSPEIISLFMRLSYGGEVRDLTFTDFTANDAKLSGLYIGYANINKLLGKNGGRVHGAPIEADGEPE